jgi:AcrR family transcriptional regulator
MGSVNGESESRPTSLRERRQLRTRRELVDAVLAVVAGGGLSETPIDRISAESGISRGTVYAHFPGGRDELLRAAYARLGRQLVERTREAVLAADDWRGRIVAHARAMFDLAGDARIGHFYNVSGPTLVVDGEERGIGSGASVVSIREELERAQAAGDVAADVDAGGAAVLLVGALREAAIGVAAQTMDPRRAYESFARLVEGLAARS